MNPYGVDLPRREQRQRKAILIGGGSILTADVRAANGVIHVMTPVFLP